MARWSRIVQLVPADGWLSIYANSDDSIFVDRVVAFALVDEWDAEDYGQTPGWADRIVRPVNNTDWGIDIDDSTNLLGVVHVSKWPEEQQQFEQLARQLNEQRRKKSDRGGR